MAETPPPNFFGGRLGSKLLQKKIGPFFTYWWPIFGRNCEKKRGFWRFWKSEIFQISAKIGRKTTFVEKFFSQFLIINLAHILRKFEVHSPKSGGAISRSVFWCTNRNCILFGSPWRYGIVLCLARAPPQVCAPTRHTSSFFPFAGLWSFWAIFFQDTLYTKWGHEHVHGVRKGVSST